MSAGAYIASYMDIRGDTCIKPITPELMVIINKVIVDKSATKDILINEQLEDVLTKLPNRRVTLSFGDTISKAYKLTHTTQKK